MELTPRRRILALSAAALVVIGAVLAVPARGYLDQRSEIGELESELTDLRRDSTQLRERRDRLEDPEHVRRIARRDHGLVAVGEESYSVLPPPTGGLVLPDGWPFDQISGPLVEATSGGS